MNGRRWFALAMRVGLVLGALVVLLLPWLQCAMGWPVFDWVDAVLGLQCHRLEGRVLSVMGEPMAMCSRCAGIYAGIGLGAALARPRWSPKVTSWVVAGAAAGMMLEAASEAMGLIGVLHPIRLVTGVVLSWPVSSLAVRWVRGGALRPGRE